MPLQGFTVVPGDILHALALLSAVIWLIPPGGTLAPPSHPKILLSRL